MMNSAEIEGLYELRLALDDTQRSARAVAELREGLAGLGCQVDVKSELWQDVANAQRAVEPAYLNIYDFVKSQARRSLER
jgi:hypothetical protein